MRNKLFRAGFQQITYRTYWNLVSHVNVRRARQKRKIPGRRKCPRDKQENTGRQVDGSGGRCGGRLTIRGSAAWRQMLIYSAWATPVHTSRPTDSAGPVVYIPDCVCLSSSLRLSTCPGRR